MTQYHSYTYRVIYRVISNTIPLPSFDHVSWKIDVMLIPLHKIILKSKINAMSINAIYEIITHNTINKIIERYDRSNAVPLLLLCCPTKFYLLLFTGAGKMWCWFIVLIKHFKCSINLPGQCIGGLHFQKG